MEAACGSRTTLFVLILVFLGSGGVIATPVYRCADGASPNERGCCSDDKCPPTCISTSENGQNPAGATCECWHCCGDPAYVDVASCGVEAECTALGTSGTVRAFPQLTPPSALGWRLPALARKLSEHRRGPARSHR